MEVNRSWAEEEKRGLLSMKSTTNPKDYCFGRISFCVREIKEEVDYVDVLKSFASNNVGGFQIIPSMIKGRELIIAIPTYVNVFQLDALDQAQVWASWQGVNIVLQIVK
jgi:hypothetical protein